MKKKSIASPARPKPHASPPKSYASLQTNAAATRPANTATSPAPLKQHAAPQTYAAARPASPLNSAAFHPAPPPFLSRFFSSSWLSNPIKQFVLLCAIFLAALLLIAIFSPPPKIEMASSEAPLAKLSSLKIIPGEQYGYEIAGADGSVPASIKVGTAPACPGVVMYDRLRVSQMQDLEFASVCLGNDGVEIDSKGNKIGTNFSYRNISWPYFSPWMLAVKEGWNWSANTSIRVGGLSSATSQEIRFKTIGKENYLGRDGFLASISLVLPNGGESEVLQVLVDSQKRILLRMESGANTIRLISAPFPLNSTALPPNSS